MPQLDIPSLLVSNVGVVLFCALLMFHSWWRGRHERTLLWAGVMLFLEGSGLLLNSLRGLGMDWLPLVVGNMVLLLCSGMTWVVMGAFCGRPPRWWLVTLGAWAWLLLCQWPAFYEDIRWRVTAFSLMLVAYILAAMYELWRGRAAQPVSVLAALLLMGGHALLYVHRLAFATWGYPPGQLHSPMFAILLIESVLYAVGMAFLVLSMVKERAEQQFRMAAYSDPLTGIGNRRAFISAGERLLRQCAAQHQPVSLLLFDLDHFKAINDRLGHAEGDRVLQAFCDGVSQRLRKADVFGRIGGEEFACLVQGTRDEALVLAERIRCEFAAAAPGAQSVSVGVAGSPDGGYDLSRLLSLADRALYAAKGAGRNRVAVQGADGEPMVAHSR